MILEGIDEVGPPIEQVAHLLLREVWTGLEVLREGGVLGDDACELGRLGHDRLDTVGLGLHAVLGGAGCLLLGLPLARARLLHLGVCVHIPHGDALLAHRLEVLFVGGVLPLERLVVRAYEVDYLLEVLAFLDQLNAPPSQLGDLLGSRLQEVVAARHRADRQPRRVELIEHVFDRGGGSVVAASLALLEQLLHRLLEAFAVP
mmetsp:Transcript_1315/g.2797  ORF Transcript_1315/g.2797 Transcript_1315/m.2797 type:complete len:203 (+) Transcript_1315:973-1581(+)